MKTEQVEMTEEFFNEQSFKRAFLTRLLSNLQLFCEIEEVFFCGCVVAVRH